MTNFRNAFSAVAIAAAISFGAAISVSAADAVPAVPTARDFTVTLPAGFGEFVPQVQTTHSPDGDIRTTNWISKAPTGEAVIISASQMPGPVRDPKKLINGASASLLKSVNGTIESEEALSEQPVSAKLMFRSPAAFFRARLIVQGARFYQVLYVGRTEAERSAPTVGQLFDSFALTAPVAAPAATAPAAVAAPVPKP